MAARYPVIACVGAGRMGRGIAHAFAYAGHEVRLIDGKPRDSQAQQRLAGESKAEIRGTLAQIAEIGGFDAKAIDGIMARITLHPFDDMQQALKGVRYIFEAVPETEEAKRAAFATIDRAAETYAIVASTTSTFLSTQLSALSGRPKLFLNAHWLNPAFIVPLIELSPTPETDRAVVEEGVASVEDIDKAVKYGFGFRFAILGLLEFIDWGGGDILYYASRNMSDAMNDKRFEAPKIVHDNMTGGRNGLRDGKGFYDYAGTDVGAYRRERLAAFLHALKEAGLARPPAGEG